MKEHYLDNSATTVVSEKAAKEALNIMTNIYGNPSSLHNKGFEAELKLEKARKTISDFLIAENNEIIFTSGGTESNNIAINGAIEAKKRLGNKIVTTGIEHSSVLKPIKQLEKTGYEVIYLKPDSNGIISIEQFSKAIDNNTILVSAMLINNETGVTLPVDKIKEIMKTNNSPGLLHCDAVQGFGKVNINLKQFSVDLMSISGHKVHGPKGVGALYIKKGTHIVPTYLGGEQENKIRPGTEPLPLISAFKTAVEEINLNKNYNNAKKLYEYSKDKLLQLDGILHNNPKTTFPYILNISVKGIKSETMVHHLASLGIYVSSSSACSKGNLSHVLQEMNLNNDRIDSSIRISFSKFNNKEDIDALYNGIKSGIKRLVKK